MVQECLVEEVDATALDLQRNRKHGEVATVGISLEARRSAVTCSAPPLTSAVLLIKLESSMVTLELPVTSSAAPLSAWLPRMVHLRQKRFDQGHSLAFIL